jgi:hypothetical protein
MTYNRFVAIGFAFKAPIDFRTKQIDIDLVGIGKILY